MSPTVNSFVLLLAVATFSAHAQILTPLINTTGCRNPSARCRFPLTATDSDPCPESLNCSGGLVLDNEKCPCCYQCALQVDQECSPVTENSVDVYRYCDVGAGLRCKNISSWGSGTPVGRCAGERVQSCVHGRIHTKGCLICTCSKGVETCVRNKDITCPNLNCSVRNRYRPVDKCCPVCLEVLKGSEPDLPPELTVLGDLSEFIVSHRGELSIIFRARGVKALSNLIIYHNGRQLQPTSRYLSMEIVRIPATLVDENVWDDFVDIKFSLKAVKKGDRGNYTLVAKTVNGMTDTSFTVLVKKHSLRNCSFETDLCGWRDPGDGNEVGWLRQHEGTAPKAGSGASGYYLALERFQLVSGGEQAILRSVLVKGRSHPTSLSFAYRLVGEQAGTLTLSQFLYDGDKNGTKVERNLWTRTGDQGNKWHTASVTVVPLTAPFVKSRFQFIATVGGAFDDIDLDSIVVIN